MTLDPTHRLLFVDDEAEVGAQFAHTARGFGFESDVATSATEAIRLARTRFYPVIVCDLRMPGMDGLALIEHISPLTPSTAFVLVTGVPDIDLRTSALVDSVIASVMRKPWDEESLSATLETALALHRRRAARTGEDPDHESADGTTPLAVLLVEGNPADATLIAGLLTSARPELRLETVTRLQQALERVHERAVQAILTDMSLPDARGFDAVTRLHAAAPATPIIVLSGFDDQDLAHQAVQLGAQDYLVKGAVDGAGLLRAIDHARERKRGEQRLVQLAHFDPLTGLANRVTFRDRITQAMTRARRRGTRFAVMFLDLDRFKQINDTWGHDAGDALLEEVGRRIRAAVREYDTVARLGGDEFALLADDLDSDGILAELGGRILEALAEPVAFGRHTVPVTCSIGIAVYPDAARTTPDLLKCADKAMYEAKRRGRNAFVFFDEGQRGDGLLHASIAGDLNVALKRGEYALHFQPQVNLTGHHLLGFETLLRWRHHDRVLPTAEFLPVLEETGAIIPVGRWATREALSWLADRRHTVPQLRLALNVSRRQLEDPGLTGMIEAELASHDLPPQAVEVEIPEPVLVRDTPRLSLTLRDLKATGVRLAVDGFGTGNASAASLTRYRIDTVKIARPFVARAPHDPDTARLVRGIIGLAQSLGLALVADGVETAEQLAFVRDEGFTLAQGYFLGRPQAEWPDTAAWEAHEPGQGSAWT